MRSAIQHYNHGVDAVPRDDLDFSRENEDSQITVAKSRRVRQLSHKCSNVIFGAGFPNPEKLKNGAARCGIIMLLAYVMHAAIELASFWTVAFLTLAVAVVLLSIFGDVIESDLELLSLGKEAVIAGIASLIEATGIWLIVLFVPAMSRGLALRAMIIPVITVALIYKMAHLESWSVHEAGLLIAFQVGLICLVASLISGHFLSAIMVVAVIGIVLAVIASFAKSL